jgi:hypothetical protein
MIKAALVATLILSATSARVDWQGTTWAMTRQEVVAVTGATLTETGPFVQNATIGAEGPYSALGYEFQARYYFGAGDVLRVVSLTLASPAGCGRLLADLKSTYGDPIEARFHAFRWLDVENNNEVLLNEPWPSSGRTECLLYYRPISVGGSRGL